MAIHKLKWGWVQKTTANGLVGDGGGLWLQVSNNGNARSWIFRFRDPVTKRPTNMGLGSLDTIDLDEAREKARECRKLLLEGKNPKVERDHAKLERDIQAGLTKTVNEVVDEYVEAKIARKSEHHIRQSEWMLRIHVRGTIGDMPIQKVDTNTLLEKAGLRKLWIEKNTVGERVHSHWKQIFSLAISRGYYSGKNPAAWVDHLKHILPSASEVHREEHHPSLPYEEIGAYMAALRGRENQRKPGVRMTVAYLQEFVLLTAVRLSEARLATWKEMDLDNMIWNVPWQHLKEGRKHHTDRPVPITKPMKAVLEEMQRRRTDHAPDALVFPSPQGGAYTMSSGSHFIKYRLKWKTKITLHGFRDTFKNWARANGFPEHLSEIQLDHVLGKTKSDQAYGRNKLVEQRRVMMEQWGEFCSNPPEPVTGANVLSLAERKRRKAS